MSRRPIDLSPDLLRLQNEGYYLEVRGGYLLVRDVPYARADRTVCRGTLVARLDLSGDVANKPSDHVAYWIGTHPCHADGRRIESISNPSPPQDLGSGLHADFLFSAKADYRDYHHKVTTYVGRIAGEAARLDPDATARTFPADEGAGPFLYVDTATARAGIGAVNSRLAALRVAIVGLGGTGSYILDLVAETAVAEIHLFDGDVMSQHNAFRAPGAPGIGQLRERPQKVAYFTEVYGRMRRGIVAHDGYLGDEGLGLLDGLDFVFLCLDRGSAKRLVVERLVANGTPFVEAGLGVTLDDGQLGGIVRVATSTPDTREAAARHISYSDGQDAANAYATNIQVAELNALNASLAVMSWKKLHGVYRDSRREHHRGYSIATGEIVTEGAA